MSNRVEADDRVAGDSYLVEADGLSKTCPTCGQLVSSGQAPVGLLSRKSVVPLSTYLVLASVLLIAGAIGGVVWLKPFSEDCWSNFRSVVCKEPVFDMEFVKATGGKFEMGCGSWQKNCAANEKPYHSVTITGFWIGKYEVTNGQWRKVMGMAPLTESCGDECSVVNVSYQEAQQFIQKLNADQSKPGVYRLPTEAEWEYACRSGGKSEKYCGGDNPDLVAWHGQNSGGAVHKVGTKAPNGLGIYDMSGNISEWVEDWHEDGYYARSAQENPHGPSGGAHRMNRGGGWDLAPVFIRSTARSYASPDNRGNNLGLRVVRDQ